ncbi:hypothetical protein CAOG_03503 [Capsaspora owczarzaki ATCC 30864]|uniref:Uncharacterized protein n=1 Tax=Capsaspora owczarzaki (strain ATCC 30864) TaxID=595528 RepID=A0A0D2WPH5_CAPO3|nr:hypothetical protein CAOG_03503 [Capsaspora owczarzaki ATCC 30864]KJE92558.1 hypothetical protein CAOG_003503 [Capsaspora owczarzaki ATCC 30864]|eukprot:XP_004348408.1 hypothetical protein CAOG_03503 [Capsaspora owczarzaki ATCC 30864]
MTTLGLSALPRPGALRFAAQAPPLDKDALVHRILSEHPLNHAVELVLPWARDRAISANAKQTNAADSVTRMSVAQPLKSAEFHVIEIPLLALLDTEFLQRHVRNGHFVAMSVSERLDGSTCVPAVADGFLTLSLSKEAYELCGLEGQLSKHEIQQRHTVRIHLAAESFVPGKSHYERVKWCFAERLTRSFKFVCTDAATYTNGDQPAPSPAHALNKHALAPARTLHLSHTEQRAVTVPQLLVAPIESVAAQDNATLGPYLSTWQTWFGAISCGISLAPRAADDFASTFQFEGVEVEISDTGDAVPLAVSISKFTGIVSSEQIKRVVARARAYLATCPELPWAALNIWGFIDAPVAYGDREHCLEQANGENDVTLILFRDGGSCVLSTASSRNELT